MSMVVCIPIYIIPIARSLEATGLAIALPQSFLWHEKRKTPLKSYDKEFFREYRVLIVIF